METKIIRIQSEEGITEQEDEALRQAGEIMRRGGLVAFPTETVYGLGGDALNPDSSRKIYAAKGRPSDNPLIVHIAGFDDIYKIVSELPETARVIAEAFWPGPLTMILPKSDAVPYETTGGLDTVAVRMPSHPVARRLIAYSGGYVAAPSANVSGRPSPTVVKYVEEDMAGKIEAIVDGGEVGLGLESTIIDLTVNPPEILRPGYVTQEMLQELLGRVAVDATILKEDKELAPKAPGMKYRHYAPKGELTIVQGPAPEVTDYINRAAKLDRESGHKVGVIGTAETAEAYKADVVKAAGSREDETGIARHLYTFLREFDEEGVTRIYSESFASDGLGQAIMNRLLKAAGHKLIRIEEEQQ